MKKIFNKVSFILLGAMIIAFACGVVAEYPNTLYQGKTAKEWANKDAEDNTFHITDCRNYKNDNGNCVVQRYFSMPYPTPTPIVEYQTQYVAQPTPTNSTNILGVSKAELLCWVTHIGNCPTQ